MIKAIQPVTGQLGLARQAAARVHTVLPVPFGLKQKISGAVTWEHPWSPGISSLPAVLSIIPFHTPPGIPAQSAAAVRSSFLSEC